MKLNKIWSDPIINYQKEIFRNLLLNLSLFLIIFFGHSCTNLDNDNISYSKELAFKNFERVIIDSKPIIKQIYQNKIQEFNPTFQKLNLVNQNNEVLSKKALKDIAEGTKDLLVDYGYGIGEINKIFTNYDGQTIALVGLVIYAKLKEEEKSLILEENGQFKSILNAKEPDLFDCILRTLGITVLKDAIDNGLSSSAGKALLSKSLRKIASRTLGWVGAAWAAYELGDCMDWW